VWRGSQATSPIQFTSHGCLRDRDGTTKRRGKATRMTTKPKTRKAPTKNRRSKVCTIEEAATIDFEPYPMSGKVPELKDFEPHLIASRMSFALMHKSKNELVKAFTSEPDLMMKLIEELAISMKFFKGAAELIDCMHTRLLVAGASYTEAS
jgi:hypothetical protein